eukprot:TRINITY_DN66358_c0_g1_i1.p2 TRINITY_DN66358_c0_g1~~TRINITY_DN66358_c0_g1_i1.p2  ORF type:complete len:216 (+),score=81.07 TRINITY_DN66358_c0_g1_i1:46-648(+)
MEVLFDDYVARSGGDANGLTLLGLDLVAEDMGLDKGDVVMIMLAWKLNCMTPRHVSMAEWVHGMSHMKILTTLHLRQFFQTLRDEVYSSDEAFTIFYNFCYDFLRTDTTKLLPLSEAVLWWQRLLPVHFRHLNQWCDFVKSEAVAPYVLHGVARDLWKQLLVFALEVENLQDHSRDGPFPVILDDFAEWVVDQRAKAQPR